MRPKKAYDDHKRHAKDRGIPFLLSYQEWLEMWLLSGKWELRGREAGCYVMARYGDVGAYSTRNCYICTVEENLADRWDGEALKDTEVSEIISLYKNTQHSQRMIGDMFGISQSHISRIVNGKRRS
jgi:hypothetical protein